MDGSFFFFYSDRFIRRPGQSSSMLEELFNPIYSDVVMLLENTYVQNKPTASLSGGKKSTTERVKMFHRPAFSSYYGRWVLLFFFFFFQHYF